MICSDCGKEVEKVYSNDRFSRSNLCRSCHQRLNILKENYKPYNSLSEDEKHKIDVQRKNNSTYNKRKSQNNDKSLVDKNKALNDEIGLNEIHIEVDQDELKKEIESNIREAFKKVSLDDNIEMNNDYNELKSILNIISIMQDNKNKEQINSKREILRKKVDVLDKYIIDILHDLESIESDNEEKQLLAAKKLSIIRKFRREIKNKEETLKLIMKFKKLVPSQDEHLDNYKKEINNFLRATEGKIYNRMVEDSKNDNKLLGIRRYRLQCSVASNTIQNRKIIKVNEIVQATDPDSAREKSISILRDRYGESVLWDRIRIERLK